jgi:hypothetical protein
MRFLLVEVELRVAKHNKDVLIDPTGAVVTVEEVSLASRCGQGRV